MLLLYLHVSYFLRELDKYNVLDVQVQLYSKKNDLTVLCVNHIFCFLMEQKILLLIKHNF